MAGAAAGCARAGAQTWTHRASLGRLYCLAADPLALAHPFDPGDPAPGDVERGGHHQAAPALGHPPAAGGGPDLDADSRQPRRLCRQDGVARSRTQRVHLGSWHPGRRTLLRTPCLAVGHGHQYHLGRRFSGSLDHRFLCGVPRYAWGAASAMLGDLHALKEAHPQQAEVQTWAAALRAVYDQAVAARDLSDVARHAQRTAGEAVVQTTTRAIHATPWPSGSCVIRGNCSSS